MNGLKLTFSPTCQVNYEVFNWTNTSADVIYKCKCSHTFSNRFLVTTWIATSWKKNTIEERFWMSQGWESVPINKEQRVDLGDFEVSCKASRLEKKNVGRWISFQMLLSGLQKLLGMVEHVVWAILLRESRYPCLFWGKNNNFHSKWDECKKMIWIFFTRFHNFLEIFMILVS